MARIARTSRITRTARSASIATAVVPPLAWVPTRVFMVAGVGVHAQERVATQLAMRRAGVADCNLLKVSSVMPPECEIIPADVGLRLIRPGNVLVAVIAMAQTQEPHQRVTPALAWVKPEKRGVPGFIAELEEEMAKGKSEATATTQVGEEALHLLADRLRIKIDAERLWASRSRARRVRIGGTTAHVGALAVSAVGPEAQDGESRTAVAFVAAVYI
jgi:arginine decarboxylase